MNVALDGAGISPQMTGVGRYFHRLLEELIPLDPTIQYTLFLKNRFAVGFDFPNLRTTVLEKEGSYFFWQNTILRKAIERGAYDFFWSPNYTIPYFLSTRSWVTIHDMSWKSLPQDYSTMERLYKNITSRHSLKKTEIIFTDSDFSKEEIRRYAAVSGEKIRRIHLGVDDHFHPAAPDEVAGFRARYDLSGKRLIGFLGSFFKRRHVGEVIDAFEILRERHPETILLLVGENHDTRALAQKTKSPNIRWLRRLQWATAGR
jgi:glycosyltransferase involved in cell wall biosynthesis